MFISVKTIWGVMHLHDSRSVWYVRRGSNWHCYHTSSERQSKTPWLLDAICMKVGKRKYVVNKCLERVGLMSSIRNGTFIYP